MLINSFNKKYNNLNDKRKLMMIYCYNNHHQPLRKNIQTRACCVIFLMPHFDINKSSDWAQWREWRITRKGREREKYNQPALKDLSLFNEAASSIFKCTTQIFPRAWKARFYMARIKFPFIFACGDNLIGNIFF